MTNQSQGFLTLQQIFDKALNGVRAQGGPSKNEEGSCAYRSADGSRACGVGHLIRDEDYRPDQGEPVQNLIQGYASFRTALHRTGVDFDDNRVVDLLIRLQHVHDGASGNEETEFLRYFEIGMRHAAADFGLTYAGPRK